MDSNGEITNNPPSGMERFKKMNENIALRGAEIVKTNTKTITKTNSKSSLLAVTRNVRSLRSSSSKESRTSAPNRFTPNPTNVVVTSDDRDDILSCYTSTSMSIQPIDDTQKRNSENSMDSFVANSHRAISLQTSYLSETPADLDLKRNDGAFESVAQLVLDHISHQVFDGCAHYSLSKEDMSNLEQFVPMSVRLRFVGALRYRSASPPRTGNDETLTSLVTECTRLGLGRDVKDNILLGGGTKMSDGTIQVMVEHTNFQHSSETIPSKSISDSASFTLPPDMSWMGRTQLTSEQMQVIMAATDSPAKKHDGIPNQSSQNQCTTDSTQISHKSLPDDMKWMIYAGLTPEQMQVTLNAMNHMKDDAASTCMSKSTIGDDQGSGDELEPRIDQQVQSRSTVNSASKVHQKATQAQTYRIPEFAWRDGLQDVFLYGILHPYCVLSFVVPLFAVGQVMTRLQFNCIGNPASILEVRGNFYSLISAAVLWFILNIVAIASFYIHWGRGIIVSFDLILFIVTNLSMFGFSVYVIANTRYNLREKYRIPASESLGTYEDYLLTATMMPFVVAQMGRHTVDHSIINYSMFSPSGLPPGVRLEGSGTQTYVPPGSPLNLV